MLAQVLDRPLKDLGGVPKGSDSLVAVSAQKTPDESRCVVMIDMQDFISWLARRLSAADGTEALLSDEHLIEDIFVETVEPSAMGSTQVFTVGLTPSEMSISGVLGILGSECVLRVPSLDGAAPASGFVRACVSVDGDVFLTSPAPSRSSVFVDLSEPMFTRQASGTSPSAGPILLDCHLSALGADGSLISDVKLGEDVVVGTRGMTSEVPHRCSLDPVSLSTGLRGDAGGLSTPAMTGSVLHGAVRRASADYIHKEDCIACCAQE